MQQLTSNMLTPDPLYMPKNRFAVVLPPARHVCFAQSTLQTSLAHVTLRAHSHTHSAVLKLSGGVWSLILKSRFDKIKWKNARNADYARKAAIQNLRRVSKSLTAIAKKTNEL